MDALLLSRIQFGLTTAFHILFPTLTIGLAVFLVIVEFLWLRKRDVMYYRMYRFWVKVFAVHFAVGVVSGITLEFEFGTNFALFSQAVANIFAPLLAYEGMTAFFLEAGFLGIMLFGWKRVPPTIHFLSTCLVAAGATLSAFWIVAANAWMQTPAGYTLSDGTLHVKSFAEAIFNPAMPTHLAHMLVASFETTAFALAGISAYFLLKGKYTPFYQRTLGLVLVLAAVLAPLQVFLGDQKGREVAEHQPAKLAAMEAHWETNRSGGAPFVAFALPDMKAEKNRMELTIPHGLSLLITHSWNGKVAGLKEFRSENRPFVPVIFWTFRIMVAIGFLFLGVMLWAGWLWRKRRLFESRGFLIALVAVQPLGFLGTELGWITTEMGRQPWVVYGLIRTSEGVSPIPAGNVVWSLLLFLAFFGIIGASYAFYLRKILRRGPDLESPVPSLQLRSGMQPLQQSDGEGPP
jgi:cytochrome bd ubiquinol oxidase subunit I